MKRLQRGFLLLLCMLLVGCAPSMPEGAPGPEDQTVISPPEQETPSSDPLVLLIDIPEQIDRYMQAFTERTSMEIELAEGTSADFEQMLTDFAAGKCTYDVVSVTNSLGMLYTMDTLVEQGYFYPLDGQPHVQESLAHMLPLLQDLVTIDGIPYALPFIVRFKVLDYNAQLYEAVETDRLSIYNRRAIVPVTESQAEQLPPKRAFATWEELLESGYLSEEDGSYACNAILEQCILDAGQEDFSFDSQEFVHALELMKAFYTLSGSANDPMGAVWLTINTGAFWTEGWLQDPTTPKEEWSVTLQCNDFYPVPTLDGQGRIPMAYSVLAVNAFTDQKEAALRFLDIAAEIGWNGVADEENPIGYVYKYGMPETAACYTDEEHLAVSAGLDPENQARWREMQANLVPITDAGFLTSFNLELFPQYLDGAITAEQCAAMTQERYRMYKLEQGE